MSDFESRVRATTGRLERALRGVPAVFREDTWPGRAILASLHDPAFRVALFRLIDVLPVLSSPEEVADHLRAHFAPPPGADREPAAREVAIREAAIREAAGDSACCPRGRGRPRRPGSAWPP